MADHAHRPIERYCDVAVVGGGAAGLAAALQLTRQRRSVIVVDADEPRNAPAAHLHGYLGHEGVAPAELAATAREEVRSYGGEVIAGRVLAVTREAGARFRVALTGGHVLHARRVLAATGLVDQLPAIDGLAAHWGKSVIHCPFCHGYEVRDRRVVHLVTHPTGLRPAALMRQLTDRYTVVLHDGVAESDPAVEALRTSGVKVVASRVARVVAGPDNQVGSVELDGGEVLAADAVLIGPRFRARADAFDLLGLGTVPHVSGAGDVVAVDETGATDVPWVYAAGNVTDPSLQVLAAAAHGSLVGAMIAFSLANDDLERSTRPSATEIDWDHRYSGEPLWSGNPNGTLVQEAGSIAKGWALDVGAGEGGDALWLAEHGWSVTACDVSSRALTKAKAEAERRRLHIDVLRADVNAIDPFGREDFDLVTASYASIPRTPDLRAVHNLLRAVSVGGTLLVVGHDLEPMRAPIDTHRESRPFDPDAYVRVEDVAKAIARAPEGNWIVETNETRPRPPGAVSTHHVRDVVFRARRVR